MSDAVLILTTVPDDERAERLARTLVEEGLAACVNLLPPMTSIYRWKGGVERDAERQLIIKSTRPRVEAVRTRIAALHSYELPEFLVISVDGGSDAYLKWLGDETLG